MGFSFPGPQGSGRAVLWQNKVPIDLNTLIPKDPSWYLLDVLSINDDREIVGYGTISGNVHAFLATPCDRAEGFSGLALALAGVGLLQRRVLQCGAADQRVRHPHGIGWQRADVLRIVALSASASVGLGLASGLALSLGLGRVITRWVENATHGPLIVLGVSLLVIVVAGLACLIPALRALAVDPTTALRCE